MTDKTPSVKPEMPKNRAAFLLGLCLQTGSVECVLEPWIKISPVLSISKVLLLDMCMARLRSHMVRAQALAEEKEPTHAPTFDIEFSPKYRFTVLKLEFHSEFRNLQLIAANLWTGQSKTRDWYLAGLKCGELVNHLPTTNKLFPAIKRRLTKKDFDDEKEAASASARRALSGRVEEIEKLRKSIMDVQVDSSKRIDALSQIYDASDCITESKVGGASTADLRNQFIYEQIMLRDASGEDLMVLVNEQREQVWPQVTDASKLREYANSYARRNGLPDLPEASPGAPRQLEN